MGVKNTLGFDKLPYKWGSEAEIKRFKEAIQNKEVPVEVNCFGTDKFEILGKQIAVKIFNDKTGHWEKHIGVEYLAVCPVCGRLMLVRAIEGTTWVAMCSKGCYEKWDELRGDKVTITTPPPPKTTEGGRKE